MISKYKSETQAILYMIASCTCFACATILIKYISSYGYHPSQIMLFRALIPTLISIPWLYRNQWLAIYFQSEQKKIYILRMLSAFIANMLFCTAVINIPLNHAVVLNFTTPLFTTIIAVTMLSEKIDFSCVMALMLGFIGTIIINEPSVSNFNYIYMCALCSSLFMSVSYILMKKLTKTERPKAIVAYSNFGCMLCALPLALLLGDTPYTFYSLIILVAIGGFNYGFLFLLTLAYQKSNVSLLQPYDFVRLVIASIGGYVLFDEILSTNTIIGSFIILCSTTFIAHKKLKLR